MFPGTGPIILIFSISILDLYDNFSTSIFSFELFIAHLDEHVIINFVRPSAFQFPRDPTIHIVVVFRMVTDWPSVASESIRVSLLIRNLMIDLLEILVAVACVLHLLLLLSLKSIFLILAMDVVGTLVGAQAQAYSGDARHVGDGTRS